MNSQELLDAITAFETFVPALNQFASVVHPATDQAPTRATTLLGFLQIAGNALGVAIEAYHAEQAALAKPQALTNQPVPATVTAQVTT